MKESEKLLFNIGQSTEYAKNYIHLQKEIVKLEIVEGTSHLLSNILSRIVALMIALFTLLFASLTLAIGLSIALSSFLYGFGLVTLLFTLLTVVLIVKRQSLMTAPILRLILKDLYIKE